MPGIRAKKLLEHLCLDAEKRDSMEPKQLFDLAEVAFDDTEKAQAYVFAAVRARHDAKIKALRQKAEEKS